MTYEKLPEESARNYQAFSIYRDMGPSRSLAKVGKELKKSLPLMERWSKKYQWVLRVKEYDTAMNEISLKTHEEEIKELTKKRIQVGRAFQAVGMAKLQDIKEQIDRGEKPNISVRDSVLAYEFGLRQEILASGLSTDKIDLPIVKIELVHSNGHRKGRKD